MTCPFSPIGRRVLAGTALVVLVIGYGCDPSIPQAQERPTAFVAIEGDTIRSPAGVTYRLRGIDAPRTALAQCIAELDAGTKARRRLQALLDTGGAQIISSSQRDAHGRILATLYVDAGAILKAEGLANPASGPRVDWCNGEK
jgi:endonuclease YncB( thermonuclease family)